MQTDCKHSANIFVAINLTLIFCDKNACRLLVSGVPWETSTGRHANDMLYQGKRLIEMHGLDWYDFHWRMYVPSIMRTTTPDPDAELYPNISPYAWVLNNPVNFIDPDGRRVHRSSNKRYATNNRHTMPMRQSYHVNTSVSFRGNSAVASGAPAVFFPARPSYINTIATAGGDRVQITRDNLWGKRAIAVGEFGRDGQMAGELFRFSSRDVVHTPNGVVETGGIIITNQVLREAQANWEASADRLRQEWGSIDASSPNFLQNMLDREQKINSTLGISPLMQIRIELIRNPQNFETNETRWNIETVGPGRR